MQSILNSLKSKGYNPVLAGVSLIDYAEMHGIDKTLDFIRQNSILQDLESIKQTLAAPLSSTEDALNTDLKKAYEIIFTPKPVQEARLNAPKIVVFSGGTGSNRLTEGLIALGLEPTLLLNAYDDGKSTGDIRRKFNVLGPSDISKNIAIAAPKALRDFLEIRLPKSPDPKESFFKFIENAGAAGIMGDSFDAMFNSEEMKPYRQHILNYLTKFKEKMVAWEAAHNEVYKLSDYGLRNMVYVGALYSHTDDSVIDYHKTNNILKGQFHLKSNIVLNNAESLWLVGVTEKGELLNSEAAIVDNHTDQDIAEVFLLNNTLNVQEQAEFKAAQSLEEKRQYIRSKAIYPAITQEAKNALADADLIVVAPTTFDSSLAATLFTQGIPEAVQSAKAPLVSISNLSYERGTRTVSRNQDVIQSMMGRDIDHVIVNNHGMSSEKKHIPVDQNRIKGFANPIVAQVEQGTGKHNPGLLSEMLVCIYLLNTQTQLSLHSGKLSYQLSKEHAQEQLRVLVNDPHGYQNNQKRIEALSCKILGISSPEAFSADKTRVVIMGGGSGTRLNYAGPKILYPINGKTNLSSLLEIFRPFESSKPLVVGNAQNLSAIASQAQVLDFEAAAGEVRGPGGTLLSVENLLSESDTIILIWGDSGALISTEHVRMLLMVHSALGNQLTLPTAWEQSPYAGIRRNAEGVVDGMFTTKGLPENAKPGFGEHDGSVFVFNRISLFEQLHALDARTPVGKEVGVLEVIPSLAQVTALCCINAISAMGYNTQEEARVVAYYRNNPKPIKLDAAPFIAAAAFPPVKLEDTLMHPNQLVTALSKSHEAYVFDIDDTLTDSAGHINDALFQHLIKIAAHRPVALITGRTNESLQTMLIDRLKKMDNMEHVMQNIYLFPENGAYGYRLSAPAVRFYDATLPESVATKTVDLLKQHGLLTFADAYKITDYKIQIWPGEGKDVATLVRQMNTILELYQLPVLSTKSTDQSLIISTCMRPEKPENHLDEQGHPVPAGYQHPLDATPDLRIANKGTALRVFAQQVNVPMDNILKIGDMGCVDGVDYPMLIGKNAISVGTFESGTAQISTSKALGKTGYEGTLAITTVLLWRLPVVVASPLQMSTPIQPAGGKEPHHTIVNNKN